MSKQICCECGLEFDNSSLTIFSRDNCMCYGCYDKLMNIVEEDEEE